MKLPVPGFVSQALSSLINNDRRTKRATFDGLEGKQSKEKLKFKQVSTAKREAIVKEILQKRKRRTLIGTLVFVLIISVLLIWVVVII